MFEPGLIAGPPLVPSNATKLDIVALLCVKSFRGLNWALHKDVLFIRSGKLFFFSKMDMRNSSLYQLLSTKLLDKTYRRLQISALTFG